VIMAIADRLNWPASCRVSEFTKRGRESANLSIQPCSKDL